MVLYLHSLFEKIKLGRLAQLVQSTSFTPRGSGVRIPQRPHQSQIPMYDIGIFCFAPNESLLSGRNKIKKPIICEAKGFVVEGVVFSAKFLNKASDRQQCYICYDSNLALYSLFIF